MKTLYEITRPIIAQISLDGNLEIPIGYAYDLYRPEILTALNAELLCNQWGELVATATRDRFVRTYLNQFMNQAWTRVDRLTPQFWARLTQSNLHIMHQNQSETITDTLFEQLITHGILNDTNNERWYGVISWYGFIIKLVHDLEDITAPFDAADIDFFTSVVTDILEILTWRDKIVAKLAD